MRAVVYDVGPLIAAERTGSRRRITADKTSVSSNASGCIVRRFVARPKEPRPPLRHGFVGRRVLGAQAYLDLRAMGSQRIDAVFHGQLHVLALS